MNESAKNDQRVVTQDAFVYVKKSVIKKPLTIAIKL